MSQLFSVLLISLVSIFNGEDEARVKALFMYKIIQSMEWPAEKNSDKYVIAILGDENVLRQAQGITRGRHVNKKEIEVVNFSEDIQMEDINLLFLSGSQSRLFDNLHQSAIENAVLMVTESPGLAEKGAGINFSSKDKKLKFQMNLRTLNQSGITSSRSMRDLARLVD